MEELNKLSEQLLRLGTNRDWQTGDETCKLIAHIFGVEVERFKLWQDPRIVAEATRFMTAFETINNPASYESRHFSEKAIDIKLFWMKKTSKTNLSWVAGAADNFEDSLVMQHKNIGIDLVMPESCDRVFVIVSNQYKLRVLELHSRLSLTDREILTNVIKLRENTVSTLEEKTSYHTAVWNAFNFEPINKRFYKELVDRFIVLRDHLTVQGNLTQSEVVSFSTRLIGRLLFIKFLDKKGLINSSVGYLSAPPGNSNVQTNYYREKLEVLFYKTLNTEIVGRRSADILTPYLNGGLFDDSVSDFYNKNVVTFPDNYFYVFHAVLEKYNFTVDESSPEFQQVAVDPEMLGRIFESLLGEMETKTNDNLRSATGAFYTPREIVSYMCEQSLLEYLKTKIIDSPDRDRRLEEIINLSESIFRDQDQNKRRDWKPYQQPILDALKTVTIFDPAIGSGAFPMGMLHLLVKVYTRIDSKYEKNLSKLKREILSRSLYGCDISTTAIEICRLRAWLSIIVDIPKGDDVECLPNLEFKFVCANTLIPLEKTIQQTLDPKSSPDLKNQLIDIRDEYFKTGSKKKKEILRKRYNEITQASLFGETKAEQQLKSYKPFDVSSSSDFYDPELMHGVESFDIVIGNPPYVSIWKIEKKLKKTYESLYKSAKGHYDLYVLFYEQGLNLLKSEGVLAYITSNKWMAQTYGKGLREILLKNKILSLLDFSAYQVFDSAMVDTQISFLKNSPQSKDYELLVYYNNINTVPVMNDIVFSKVSTVFFRLNDELNFKINLTTTKINLLNKIKFSSEKIDNILYTSKGAELHSTVNKIKKEVYIQDEYSDGFRNYIEGKCFDRYVINKIKYLNYQPEKHKAPVFPELFESEKIIVKNVVGRAGIQAIIDDQKLYNNDAIINGVPYYKLVDLEYSQLKSAFSEIKLTNSKKYSLRYILGILNSKVTSWYFKELFSNGLHFYPRHLREMLVPKITTENKKEVEQVEKLVEQILTIKKENKDADTKNLESQIDHLVYKLYDLTPEEIEIIENSIKK